MSLNPGKAENRVPEDEPWVAFCVRLPSNGYTDHIMTGSDQDRPHATESPRASHRTTSSVVSDFPMLDTSRSVGHVYWRGLCVAIQCAVRYCTNQHLFHLIFFSLNLTRRHGIYIPSIQIRTVKGDSTSRRAGYCTRGAEGEARFFFFSFFQDWVIDTIITPYSDGYRYRYAPVVDLE